MCRSRRVFTTAVARRAVSRSAEREAAIPMSRYGKLLVEVGVATVGVEDTVGSDAARVPAVDKGVPMDGGVTSRR